MEEFAQSSGEHGIVVFTLGFMVKNKTDERANEIASALAHIPQKRVIWRYDVKKRDTLRPNTRLYNWLLQNDLLNKTVENTKVIPKPKPLSLMGGTNGIYEAIYHGIPMVGIPLFVDPAHNIARMKTKGAAVRYKENAMKLSRIHHDQLMKPLDRAVFWIKFVMRHKGAKHLRPASLDLTWVQYHSLDVIGFLLACVATVIFVITRYCLFCCWDFVKTGKQKKRA